MKKTTKFYHVTISSNSDLPQHILKKKIEILSEQIKKSKVFVKHKFIVTSDTVNIIPLPL